MNFKIYQLLYISIFAFVNVVNAQSVQYSPLRCAGEIPNDFLLLNFEKIDLENQKIDNKNQGYSNSKIEKEFVNKSTFRVDDILFSGKILYGDVLTNYVNDVANIVLESDPNLRKKLRFYVLKSSSVNAFSTYQGIIFVTVGLLSQIENEAQLAFILSHGIAHYKLNHTLNSYKTNEQLKKGNGKYSNLSLEKRIEETFNYSKENELEADKEGYAIFSKTKYSKQAVIESFDMLLYSYLAYDEIEWNPAHLQDSFYRFPSLSKYKKEGTINADEEEDDEHSTHPNIRKRKENIEKIIKEKDLIKDTALVLTNEKTFNFIQKQARTELFFILINQTDYKRLYYFSYLYSKNYQEDSAFCKHLYALGVYGLANKKTNNNEFSTKKKRYYLSDDEDDEEEYEGAFNSVNLFFDGLNGTELSVLSSRMAWQNYSANLNNSMAKEIFIKSVYTLFKKSNYTVSYFETVENDTIVKKNKVDKSNEKLTKSQKLKLKQQKQKEEAEESDEKSTKSNNLSYIKGGFTFYLQNKTFKQLFDSIAKVVKEEKIKEDEDDENEDNSYSISSKDITKYGHNLGLDSLILLNPNYSTYKYKAVGDKILVNHLLNEQNEIFLTETYIEMAKENGIQLSVINMLDRQNLTTEKLNEYSILTEWLTERTNNFNNNSIVYNKQFVSTLAKDKQCNKIMLSGVTYLIEGRTVDGTLILLSALAWPTLPLTLTYLLDKTREVTISTIILDLETGELVYLDNKDMNFRAKKNIIRNQIFALFHDIKTKRK